MYYVYLHNNKINNRKYIGITKQSPEKRWGIQGNNYRSSPYFYNSIQKYGWDNFEHIILFANLTKEEACEKEMALIRFYNMQDKKYGYNIMEGGTAPTIPNDIRIRISHALRGNKNGVGHPCSAEKRKKISEAQKGRKLTDEHREKLSKAAQKRHVPCSDEKNVNYQKFIPIRKKYIV